MNKFLKIYTLSIILASLILSCNCSIAATGYQSSFSYQGTSGYQNSAGYRSSSEYNNNPSGYNYSQDIANRRAIQNNIQNLTPQQMVQYLNSHPEEIQQMQKWLDNNPAEAKKMEQLFQQIQNFK